MFFSVVSYLLLSRLLNNLTLVHFSWRLFFSCIDIFVGQLRSTLTCTFCEYKSYTFDPFWDLSLPIRKDRVSYIDAGAGVNNGSANNLYFAWILMFFQCICVLYPQT